MAFHSRLTINPSLILKTVRAQRRQRPRPLLYLTYGLAILAFTAYAGVVARDSLPLSLPASSAQPAPATTATRALNAPPPVPSATSVPALPAVPTVPPASVVTLAAVGDIMLAGRIGDRIAAGDASYPFGDVAPALQDADIAVGNLESAISDGGEPLPKAFRFRAPPAAAAALALAGIDLVTLANNHAMDYGPDALGDTLRLLDGAGVAHVGAGLDHAAAHAPAILERNGLRLAFLGYVDVPVEWRGWDARTVIATESLPGVAWADRDRIASDVAAARAQADLVVVLMHSGFEYQSQPNAIQIAIAHTAIDAGAALVLGSHSHTLQGVESYHGGVIAYSLGNFVFRIQESRDSAILKVNLSRDGVEGIEWIPVVLDADGAPRLAGEEARERIWERVGSLSAALER